MNDYTSGDRRGGNAAESGAVGQALQPERAFVVQVRSGPMASRRRLQGRVELVVSGEALRFGSTAELIDFVTRLLDAQRASSATRGTAPRALEDRAPDKPGDASSEDGAIGIAPYSHRTRGD